MTAFGVPVVGAALRGVLRDPQAGGSGVALVMGRRLGWLQCLEVSVSLSVHCPAPRG